MVVVFMNMLGCTRVREADRRREHHGDKFQLHDLIFLCSDSGNLTNLCVLVTYSEIEKIIRRMRGCATCIITVARCGRDRVAYAGPLPIAGVDKSVANRGRPGGGEVRAGRLPNRYQSRGFRSR
jgi:hypothetical protein